MTAPWLIQRGSSQFSAPDAATIEEWSAAGRIAADDYLFNPLLQRWMFAKEAPEFRRGAARRATGAAPFASSGHPGGFDAAPRSAWRWVLNAPVLVVVGLISITIAYNWNAAREETAHQVAVKAEADAKAKDDSARLVRYRAAVQRLSLAGDVAALADCRIALSAELSGVARDTCRKAYADEAVRAATGNEVATARAALMSATQCGLIGAAANKIRAIVDESERREAVSSRKRARSAAAEQAKLDAVERMAYAAILRNRFLDLGADVKVEVSGAKYDRITLQWVLFNDVWAHRMTKPDGIMSDLHKLHFRRVDMRDGYQYHVYWDLDE